MKNVSMKEVKKTWFVCNDSGDVAGHDLSKERAEEIAVQMREKQPNDGWEALDASSSVIV